jgi:Adenylate and Guanylate cyclase catalytic domain
MCVTGLPELDEQHAVNMSRFAYQCLVKMDEVTHELSDVLGLGTQDLQMRIGLHSGPVTAGVLRGQKSRFQLFGDTVNTASRMESTGAKGRIQVSESTANLLVEAGKRHWIQEREDRVVAKGKGELRTFWLEPRRRSSGDGMYYGRVYEQSTDPTSPATPVTPSYPMTPGTPLTGTMDDQARALRSLKLRLQEKKVPSTGESITLLNMNVRLKSNYRVVTEEKYERLIDCNTDILLKYMQAVLAKRDPVPPSNKSNMREVNHDAETHELPPPYESVADVILLPDFVTSKGNGRKAKQPFEDDSSTDLDMLRADLRLYVAEIASLYQDVPFHNFEVSLFRCLRSPCSCAPSSFTRSPFVLIVHEPACFPCNPCDGQAPQPHDERREVYGFGAAFAHLRNKLRPSDAIRHGHGVVDSRRYEKKGYRVRRMCHRAKHARLPFLLYFITCF